VHRDSTSDALTIAEVEYGDAEATLRAIRFEVFVDEQNVPPEIEMDERDPHCIHLLACSEGTPVGTARIDLEHDGKVGRLAVVARCRRQGIGRALMERCHEIAADRGLVSVWCNAQVSAVPFYESLGYQVEGEVFDEAGIDHLKMTRPCNVAKRWSGG
jgi:predicted GNAT family N-acyltransferase